MYLCTRYLHNEGRRAEPRLIKRRSKLAPRARFTCPISDKSHLNIGIRRRVRSTEYGVRNRSKICTLYIKYIICTPQVRNTTYCKAGSLPHGLDASSC